jgi:hypothetical protein
MRSFLLAVLLATTLAVPGFAQESGTLSFTLNNPPTTRTSTSFNASIGGVQGTIMTRSGGAWTMTVFGQPFAAGTYTCGSGSCSFTGNTLAGKSLSFTMANTVGTLPGLFPNHGAWVSTVTDWAHSHLKSKDIGDVVSEAAGGKGKGHK